MTGVGAARATPTLVTVVPRPEPGRTARRGLRVVTPLAVLLAWVGVTATGLVSPRQLPAPWTVLGTAAGLVVDGRLGAALLVSFERVLYGTTIGLVTGVLLAVTAGLFRTGEDVIDAPMQMVRALPWAGMMPVFVIWFGIDEASKIALVALATVFPFYINTFTGIRGVDAGLVDAAATLGLSRRQQIGHVLLPGALPNFLVGTRYALGSAWIALVFAEQVNADAGIGALIARAREVSRADVIMVALVTYALLGLVVDGGVRLMERGWLTWRQTYTG